MAARHDRPNIAQMNLAKNLCIAMSCIAFAFSMNSFGVSSQVDVIQALRDRGLWPEPPRRVRTATEQRAWRCQQARDERDLPAARWYARAAATVAEEALAELDAADFR